MAGYIEHVIPCPIAKFGDNESAQQILSQIEDNESTSDLRGKLVIIDMGDKDKEIRIEGYGNLNIFNGFCELQLGCKVRLFPLGKVNAETEETVIPFATKIAAALGAKEMWHCYDTLTWDSPKYDYTTMQYEEWKQRATAENGGYVEYADELDFDKEKLMHQII